MEAGLLHRLSGGRFALGLGASPAALVGRLGIDAAKPLTVMRETLAVLRELLAGRPTSFEGDRVRLRDVSLSLPAAAGATPLYLGAIGDRMLGLAGQLADGLIFSVLCPLPFIRRALGHVAAGAAATRRDAAQIDVVAYVPFALRANAREARDLLRPEIAANLARFAGKPDVERLLTLDGPLDAARMQWIARRVAENVAPGKIIDDDLVDALCLAGNEDDVRRRLDAYDGAGVREIALFGVGTDAAARAMLTQVTRIIR
jgi:5,10-methylenetetrahydromethanopterin reductase